jgi:hypothetical protein
MRQTVMRWMVLLTACVASQPATREAQGANLSAD